MHYKFVCHLHILHVHFYHLPNKYISIIKILMLMSLLLLQKHLIFAQFRPIMKLLNHQIVFLSKNYRFHFIMKLHMHHLTLLNKILIRNLILMNCLVFELQESLSFLKQILENLIWKVMSLLIHRFLIQRVSLY